MRGRITDNSKKLISKVFKSEGEIYKAISNLTHISNTPIRELTNRNPYLLIFPNILGKSIDADQNICTVYQDTKGSWLETGNIMGFVSSNDLELVIRSRFHSSDNDYFLHYMLQKVFDINILELSYSSGTENIWEFLIFLFPSFLKQAVQQGIYKEYVHNKYNNMNIRGAVDVNRHIKTNTPFNCKIAYNVREHSYDNHITQLIRHTIQFINTHKHSGNILNNDAETLSAIKLIHDCTPSFKPSSQQQIIHRNNKILNHPYYTEYAPLQQLCIAILSQDSLSFGDSKNKVHGLLFDGAWLWEEYLGTILKNHVHTDNRNSRGKIPLFKGGGNIYPDFYKKNNNKIIQVLDAKYKVLKNNNREDYYQLLSYMFRLNTGFGYLLYPEEVKNQDEPNTVKLALSSEFVKPAIHNTYIYKIGLPIPKHSDNYQDYIKKMQNIETKILALLEKTCLNNTLHTKDVSANS